MKEKLNKKTKTILCVVIAILLLVVGAISGGLWGYHTYAFASDGDLWETKYKTSAKEYETLKKTHDEYVEKMKPFEEMTEAEAEARKLAAEKEAKEQAEKEKQEKEAAKKAQAEKEKKGYDSGITYDQLARTPDKYTGEKIKFSGKVIQVMEEDGSTGIRLAVNSNYDNVILGTYDSSIVSSRVLEDDQITVYGVSAGLYSYETVMGDTMTIPAMTIDKIDQ